MHVYSTSRKRGDDKKIEHFLFLFLPSTPRKMAAQNLTNLIRTSDLLTFQQLTMTINRLNKPSLAVSKDGGRRIPRETTGIIRGEEVVDETETEMGRLEWFSFYW